MLQIAGDNFEKLRQALRYSHARWPVLLLAGAWLVGHLAMLNFDERPGAGFSWV